LRVDSNLVSSQCPLYPQKQTSELGLSYVQQLRQLDDVRRDPRRPLAGCTPGAASTKMRCMAEVHGRVDPMDDDYGVISQAESDEGILAFDVSKRTASTEQQAFTWIYCTGAWQYCPA